MKFLISAVSITCAVIFAVASGRNVPLPEKKSPDSNVILLEVPVTADKTGGSPVKLDGENLILEGRNFSSLKEMVNIIEEDKKGKSSPSEESVESYSIVVPIARNFSSLKELFAILGEDSNSKPKKSLETFNQSYVKGTEANSSDYTIFFTP